MPRIQTLLLLFLLTLVTRDVTGMIRWLPEWTWTCDLNAIDGPSCIRKVYNNSGTVTQRLSPASCLLTCGPHGALWPYPFETRLGTELMSFHPNQLILINKLWPSEEVKVMLAEAMTLTRHHITQTYELGIEETSKPFWTVPPLTTVKIELRVTNPDAKIKVRTDESYTLQITSTKRSGIQRVTGKIDARTYFGARHGLETLTQLIAYNEFSGLLEIVSDCTIVDRPKFMYRGLMIDTGRNFIPIPALKKMIDAMTYNKLNIFHWHLSDSNSFPFESRSVPQVTAYGTYSPKKIYTIEQVKDFVIYANLRGIKVIPELDAPSHAGNGWQWGPLEGLGELALCVNAEPYRDYCIQPPCGQLNPLNPHTYDILGKLYRDLFHVFDRDVFHMGNDEVSYKCWQKSPEILAWLKSRNTTDLMELWGVYQEQALAKLKEANGNLPLSSVVWTSNMTADGRRYLPPKDYVIQIWSLTTDNATTKDILNESYRVVFSNFDVLYLDHGYGPWRDNGYPPVDKAKMKYWQNFYAFDILAMVQKLVGKSKADQLFKNEKILGGEATVFSEKADELNMEMKLWPRSAALAERLWSNPGPGLPRFAYPRLINHRLRMIQRGTRVDTLLPESCYYLRGTCD